MRAGVGRAEGPPGSLYSTRFPEPARPGPRKMLVRVYARGSQFPDVLFPRAKYQGKITPRPYPGIEIAGEVIARGDGASLARDSGYPRHQLRSVRRNRRCSDTSRRHSCPTMATLRRTAAFGVHTARDHALRRQPL